MSNHTCRFALIVCVTAMVCVSALRAEPPRGSSSSQEKAAGLYGSYLHLLEGYRRRDESIARELGNFWAKLEAKDYGTALALIRLVPIELATLSQMALTDLGVAALATGDKPTGELHLLLAARWIDLNLAKTPNDSIAHARQMRFARDWYHAMIWLRFARNEWTAAAKYLETARQMFPDDPDVQLSSGTLEELNIFRIYVEQRHDNVLDRVKVARQTATQQHYVHAVGYFRRAIELDPNNAEARIRLGRVLERTGFGRADEALTLLNEARTLAPKPPLSYIASLFAGRVHEREHQLEDAATSYRQAIADCPRAQTARLALSHVQVDQNPNLLGAQNSLRPLIGGPPPEDGTCEPDPWRMYAFGQAWRLPDLIIAMRLQVREPEGSQP